MDESMKNELTAAQKEENEFLRNIDKDTVNCFECGRELETHEVKGEVHSAEDILCPECYVTEENTLSRLSDEEVFGMLHCEQR